MHRLFITAVCVTALLRPANTAAQSSLEPKAEQADLAALLVTRESGAGGHRARLASHAARVLEGEGSALVSAAVFLPDGESVATQGLVAFLLGHADMEVLGGEVRFVWGWTGMDTVLAFPARVLAGRGTVAYAAELTELDLRFLATARSLEVWLPDGTVLALDADLRRRLGLLARLSGLPVDRRDALAAFTRSVDRSMRDRQPD